MTEQLDIFGNLVKPTPKPTNKEKAKIEEKAKMQGLSVSAYLRMMGLKGEGK